MRKVFSGILIVFAIIFATSTPAVCADIDKLDSGLHKLLKKILEKQDTATASIMISPNNFFDSETDKSAPLAVEIYKHLEDMATIVGVNIKKPHAGILNGWIIKGYWFPFGDQMSISLQAVPWVKGERGKIIVVPVSIPMESVSDLLDVNDMDAWGRTLVHRLQKQQSQTHAQSVYLRPLQIDGQVLNLELLDMLSSWLHKHLINSNTLIPLSVSEELEAVYDRVLRKRAKEKGKLCLTAALLDASNQLTGKASIGKEKIAIKVQLEDNKGKILSDASIAFSTSILPDNISLNETKDTSSMMEAENSLGLSLKGLEIEITSQRGELSTVYHENEKIRFFVKVNKPSWLYIINVNSSGEAFMLYSTPKEAEKMDGERMLIVPDDVLPYKLNVEPPFGKDIIWAVAAEEKLDIPAELTGKWADAKVLKQRIRSMSKKNGKGYSEARLLIITKK
ncbi:MAG: DUF4384 domain-containing protein [Alphaproteobacteria bacterium]|nr:DUF4384 domain-containing protein [Alphaproteobacteria bacterium]